jgi:hypothetical protein
MEPTKPKKIDDRLDTDSLNVEGKEDEVKLIDQYESIWELDLKPEQEDRLLRVIGNAVDSFEKNTESFRKEIYKWDDQYEGVLLPKVFPWEGCANYHVPITELNVNSLYSRVIKRFRTMDYLRVKSYKETKERSLITQKYLRYLFEKKMKYTDLLMSVGRDILKYGSGVFITTWDYYERTKTVVVPRQKEKKVGEDPYTKAPIMDTITEYVIEEQSTLEQTPRIEWVDLTDYFRSEESNRFVEPSWEARRLWVSATEYYHRAQKKYYDPDVVNKILAEELKKLPDDQQFVDRCGEREVIEWWGWMTLEESTKEKIAEPQRIVFTYDKKAKKILKVMRFPYLFDNSNFTVINMERRSDTWRGRGMCQKLEHVNIEMDKLHDLYIDSAALVTCKSFKKKRGSDTNFLLEQFYPGVVWDVGKMDDIEVMDLGDVPLAPMNELNMLEQLAAKQTGIGSYQTGQDIGPSQPTASGQLAVIQEGNITLDEIAKEFTFGTIRMAQQVLQMVKQFRPEDEFLEVMDEQETDLINKIAVDIDELIEDPELIIVDRSVLEEQDYKMQGQELYNLVRSDPILMQIPRIYVQAIRNLTTAYKTIDSDLLVPTEEEILEVSKRISEQVAMQDMQKEIAKGQFQMQIQQLQAQVQQAKIQAQAATAAGAQKTQVQIAADKNKANLEGQKLDQAHALETQARDQDAAAVTQVLQSGTEGQPA